MICGTFVYGCKILRAILQGLEKEEEQIKGMEGMKRMNLIEMMEQVKARARIVDLSHTMETGMPAWPTQARYGAVVYESYDFGAPAIHSMITMSEHTGTHVDAPRHFIRGGCPVDRLPVETVMGRGVTVDASHLKERGVLSLEAVLKFEDTYGPIKKGDIVMFRFGWDEKFAILPENHGFLEDWPGLSGEAAKYLVEKEVAAVGCDTMSLDVFGAEPNVCHQILLGQGIPILENLNRLKELPAFSYVAGLPNKLKDGSGSPIRVAAFVEDEA